MQDAVRFKFIAAVARWSAQGSPPRSRTRFPRKGLPSQGSTQGFLTRRWATGRLLPLETVFTPNVPDAEALTGQKSENLDDARRAAVEIVALGAKSAVVKGGHLEGPATDILYDGHELRAFTAQKITTTSTHGTGCTFASATAAGLAKGLSVRDAVGAAKKYVTATIRHAFPMGGGHGPLNHFYRTWG